MGTEGFERLAVANRKLVQMCRNTRYRAVALERAAGLLIDAAEPHWQEYKGNTVCSFIITAECLAGLREALSGDSFNNHG